MGKTIFFDDTDIMVDPMENFSIGTEDWSTDSEYDELDDLSSMFD